MKTVKLLSIITIFLFGLTFQSRAQQVTLSLSSVNPSADITKWEEYPTSLILTVNNSTSDIQFGVLQLEIRQGSSVIARTSPSAGVFLELAPGSSVYTADVIFPASSIDYVGILPGSDLTAGDYEICAHLLLDSPIEVPPSCTFLIINEEIIPETPEPIFTQAPILITPMDGIEILPDERITFTWTRSIPDGPYEMLVFEIREGQQPMIALRVNQPIIHESIEGSSMYTWGPDYEMPNPGGKYVWTVRIVDDLGLPFDDGLMAEPGLFTISKSGTKDTPPEFSDEQPGCDTIRQAGALMRQQLVELMCSTGNNDMGRLKDLFEEYYNLCQQQDELMGKKDVIEKFGQMLAEMKQSTEQQFDQDISDISGNSEGENCAPDWENDFENRYVNGRGGSPARAARSVNRANSTFERLQRNAVKNLEERKGNAMERFDNFIQTSNEQKESNDNAIAALEAEKAEKKAALDQLMGDIEQNLRNVNLKWSDMLNFMEANYVCFDCERQIQTLPDDLANIGDCLSSIMASIDDLKGLMYRPTDDDQDRMQNQANGVFDFGELESQQGQLADQKEAWNQLLSRYKNQGVQFSHPACKRFHELRTGYYIYDTGEKPMGSSSLNGGKYGVSTQNVIPVPTSNNPDDRDAFRDTKRAFESDAREIQQNMRRAVWKLSNGWNGGPMEGGLVDNGSVNAHGQAAAIPYHQSTYDELSDMLDDWFDKLGNCFNSGEQNANGGQYVDIITRCYHYKLCLRNLSTQYQELMGELGEMRRESEEAIRNLRGRISQLRSRLQGLESDINLLKNQENEIQEEINNLGQDSPSEMRGSVVRARQEFNGRLEELNALKRELENNANGIRNDIHNAESNLRNMERNLEDLNEAIDPENVNSEDACERESERLEQIQSDREAEFDRIQEDGEAAADAVSDAETSARIAERETAELQEDLGNLADDVEQRELELTEMERELRRIKETKRRLLCQRLLAEGANLNDNSESPSLINPGEIQEIIDDLNEVTGYLDQVNDGIIQNDNLSEFLDQLGGTLGDASEVLGKMQEIKDQLEEFSEILDQLLNPSIENNADLFQKAIEIASAIANNSNIPVIGDMLGFYAEAYEAAIGGIMAIGDEFLEKINPIVNQSLRQFSDCTQELDIMGDKTLDDLANEAWNHFKSNMSEGGVIVGTGIHIRNEVEEYYKEQMKMMMLKCCIDLLDLD
jgi:prefoldin subunit 5